MLKFLKEFNERDKICKVEIIIKFLNSSNNENSKIILIIFKKIIINWDKVCACVHTVDKEKYTLLKRGEKNLMNF